ncbi:hypothetical protein JCM6882_005237 [Rhodosporidiobolus microsporus]
MPSPAAWSPPRARVQIKLAIQRTRLLVQKTTAKAKATRREVAGQLEKGRIESARIKVEGLLSEDLYVELLEVLELYCELLLARFGLLETVKEIDPGVQEAVAGVIHAAPRTELKELHVLREMLMSKGGREFSIACIDNEEGIVPERVTSKLIVTPPASELIDLYLYEIAKAYSVDWRPEGFPDPNAPVEEAAPPSASSVPTAVPLPSSTTPAPPPGPQSPSKAPPSVTPFDAPVMPGAPPADPAKADNTVVAKTNLPTGTAASAPAPGLGAAPSKPKEDEFEALRRRFDELKRK